MSELMPGMRVKVKGGDDGLPPYWATTVKGPNHVWLGGWRVTVLGGEDVLVDERDILEWWEQTLLPLDDKVKINPKWAWEG